MPVWSVDGLFALSAHGTDAWTEVRAGTLSFLSCAYLLPLIPQLLQQYAPDGADNSEQRTAAGAALSSAAATLLSAALTNYPLLLVPGLGLTTSFAAVLSTSSLQHALASAGVTGLLLVAGAFLSVDRVARRVVPDSVQLGVMGGLGLLVALAGLRNAGLPLRVRDGAAAFEAPTLGWAQVDVALAAIGFLTTAALLQRGVRGAILITVLSVAVASYAVRGVLPPLPVFEAPRLQVQALRASALLPLSSSVAAMLTFAVVAVFDVSAVVHSVAHHCPLDARVEARVFLASGAATILAAFLGCPVRVRTD